MTPRTATSAPQSARIVSVSSSPLGQQSAAAPSSAGAQPLRKHRHEAPDREKHLRLVVPEQRRRTSPVLLLVAGTVIVALFGLAAFHNLMASAQYDLERVERELELEQARLVDLDFQIQKRNAPGEVEKLARGVLGMIDPSDAVDLNVTPALLAEVQTASTNIDRQLANSTDWATLKPLLGAS
jgi:hypothetical protein